MICVTAVALVTGLLLRIINLEADPYYSIWTGYITDEGRWTEQARNIVLFGSVNINGWLPLIHFIFSPIYQSLTAISFSLFGVSFTSARLISALCGGALLLATFLFLRRRFSADALFLSILVLAVQPDLLFLSRVAIPEVAAMLFEFLAFATLVSTPPTPVKAALGGLLTAVALGMKATVAPIVPIFLLILITTQRSNGITSLLTRVGAFLGMLILPVIIIVAGAAVLTNSSFLEHVWGSLQPLGNFVQHASLYSILSYLFYGEVALSLNLLLVGAWIMAGLLIAAGHMPTSSVQTIYIGSAIWVIGWLTISAGLVYFPPRYAFHVLVPLILNLGAGLTLLQTLGWHKILGALSHLEGARRIIVPLWLSLPIAVLLCPAVITAADLAGFTIDRFREQLPLLLLLSVVSTIILVGIWRSDASGIGTVVFPLIATLLGFAAVQFDIIENVFWKAAGKDGLLTWVLLIAIAGMITVFLSKIRNRPGVIRSCAYLYLLAFGGIWLWQSLPAIINPSYTIANASAELAYLADEDTSFGTGSAASLFLNNKLQYTQQLDGGSLPEILVVAFDKVGPSVLEHYRLIHQQDLRIARKRTSGPTLKIYRIKQR